MRASSAATTGSSTAPGTRTTSGSSTEHALAAASARSVSASVISACQRVTAMARVSPAASTVSAAGRPSPLTVSPLRLARSPGAGQGCATAVSRAAAVSRAVAVSRGAVSCAAIDRGGQAVDEVTEPVPLDGQVAEVLRGGGDGQRDPPGHLDAEPGQPADLVRVVGEEAYRAHPEIGQDLGSGRVLPRVGGQAEFQVGVHGVGAGVLELVGAELAEQADPPALVAAQVQHDAASLGGDRGHRRVQLVPAVTPARPEHVAGQALRVRADQNVPAVAQVAQDENHVLGLVHRVLVTEGAPLAVGVREPGLDHAADLPLAVPPVLDELGDG